MKIATVNEKYGDSIRAAVFCRAPNGGVSHCNGAGRDYVSDCTSRE